MADQTFDLYKLLVEEAREARRARRELSNTFLTLNLAGVGALGFLARGEHGLEPGLFGWCAFALALTCVIWRTTNSYYTVMLAAKYKEIYAIEDKLGMRPIQNEWQTIHGKRAAMKWFSLERAMPVLFVIGYAVFFAVQAGGENITILWANVQAFFADLLARVR
jgi:hypothetical protein